METECVEKLRISREEWRAASEEYSRIRGEHEGALDVIKETYAVDQAAKKARIALDALEKYHRAVKAFRELFGDLPLTDDDLPL